MDERLDRRTVAKGGALTGFAAALALLRKKIVVASPSTPGTTEEQTLYDRLGGIFGIAAVTDRFSDAIIVNPKLNINPALKEWNEKEAATRLPGLKFMRTIWVAALTGGPFTYTGLPLGEAHMRFHLAPEDFDEVGAEIVRALDYYKVPEDAKNQLVAAYMMTKTEVVTGHR